MMYYNQKLFDSNWYRIMWPAFGESELSPPLGDQTHSVLFSLHVANQIHRNIKKNKLKKNSFPLVSTYNIYKEVSYNKSSGG